MTTPGGAPLATVVLCTYNRADRIEAAVRGVLAQEGCDLELVVVDDGSGDTTPEVLAAIDDPRLRAVHRPNGGLGAARNTGLAAATGDWIVFLDDDDRPQPGWLATLTAPAGDPEVGVSCCAAMHVDEQGAELFPRDIHPLGQPFGDVVGSYAAGTFAARTALVREAGGYLAGLGSSHQFDLFLRLLTVTREHGCTLVASPDRLLHLETRDAADRPLRNPRSLYSSSTWILSRYPDLFAGQHRVVAAFEGIAGVAAARQGDWATARRRLGRAVRARPTSPRDWSRLGLTLVPALGDRAWNRHGTWSSHGGAKLGVLDQRPATRAAGAAGPDGGDDGTAPGGDGPSGEPAGEGSAGTPASGPDGGGGGAGELFLPWRYRENPRRGAAPDGDGNEGSGPLAAGPGSEPAGAPDRRGYRLAARLARRHGWAPVLDVGCGDGRALCGSFGARTGTVGVDAGDRIAAAERRHPDRVWAAGGLEEETTWKELDGLDPGLVLCFGALERADDPVGLLHRLAEVAAGAPVLLTAADRARHDPGRPLGPPRRRGHLREWTADQFELLLVSTGHRVERLWHLGRRPGRRDRMAFLARAGTAGGGRGGRGE